VQRCMALSDHTLQNRTTLTAWKFGSVEIFLGR
jgi:hypothetical protein